MYVILQPLQSCNSQIMSVDGRSSRMSQTLFHLQRYHSPRRSIRAKKECAEILWQPKMLAAFMAGGTNKEGVRRESWACKVSTNCHFFPRRTRPNESFANLGKAWFDSTFTPSARALIQTSWPEPWSGHP
jgi:hypothetical protein